jgi:hypothetical protein
MVPYPFTLNLLTNLADKYIKAQGVRHFIINFFCGAVRGRPKLLKNPISALSFAILFSVIVPF